MRLKLKKLRSAICCAPLMRARRRPARCPRRAGRHGQNHAENGFGRSVAHFFFAADKWPPAMWPVSWAMTPANCSGLSVKLQQAGVEKFVHALGDKGIDDVAFDDNDSDAARVDIGGAIKRRGKRVQIIFDLGVADENRRLAAARFLRVEHQAGHLRENQRERQQPAEAFEATAVLRRRRESSVHFRIWKLCLKMDKRKARRQPHKS